MTRVFMPCTGLGREQRGFEAFTRSCAAALAGAPALELRVYAGGGELRPGERRTWSLGRRGTPARAVAAITGSDPYFVEQASFFASFLPTLAIDAPDLIYFGDLNLGNALWHWRRTTGQRYRLLYYNGGPTTMPFTRCDFVQQVSPEHAASAIARGEAAERQFLLPHGVAIPATYVAPSAGERAAIRASLGVPAGAPLVLSVGALNCSHKRMDYVIGEVAGMPSRPHLLLLGAEGPETPQVRSAASRLLGNRCTILTLSHEDTLRAYRAADAFVLASLHEGFGLAQVEALAAGVACVAHDTATTRYIFGTHGMLGNLSRPATLTPLLERALRDAEVNRAARHARAHAGFSWDVLAPRYATALAACAAGRLPDGPAFATDAPAAP